MGGWRPPNLPITCKYLHDSECPLRDGVDPLQDQDHGLLSTSASKPWASFIQRKQLGLIFGQRGLGIYLPEFRICGGRSS